MQTTNPWIQNHPNHLLATRASLRAMHGEGETSAGGRGRSRRSDPGCGRGDPGRSQSGAEEELPSQAARTVRQWSRSVQADHGRGPGRAFVPITAGDEASVPGTAGGRGAQCAGEPAQESQPIDMWRRHLAHCTVFKRRWGRGERWRGKSEQLLAEEGAVREVGVAAARRAGPAEERAVAAAAGR